MILYFTGTGNCLYVARELAAEGERVLSIPQELRRVGELAYADDAIGIVYPIYGHMMPDWLHRARGRQGCPRRPTTRQPPKTNGATSSPHSIDEVEAVAGKALDALKREYVRTAG